MTPSIESFSLLFKTPLVEETFAFYATLFEKIGSERSTTSSLKISLHESSKCALQWKGRFIEQLSRIQEDPDGREVSLSSDIHTVFLRHFHTSHTDTTDRVSPNGFSLSSVGEAMALVGQGDFSVPDQSYQCENSLLPLPLRTTVVLRSQCILDTLSFYQGISSWQEEKHGNGPTHYSSLWGDAIVEIYPQRKTFPATVELVVPVKDLVLTIEQLKTNHFTFIQESSSSALLQDPNKNLIQLVLFSTITGYADLQKIEPALKSSNFGREASFVTPS